MWPPSDSAIRFRLSSQPMLFSNSVVNFVLEKGRRRIQIALKIIVLAAGTDPSTPIYRPVTFFPRCQCWDKVLEKCFFPTRTNTLLYLMTAPFLCCRSRSLYSSSRTDRHSDEMDKNQIPTIIRILSVFYKTLKLISFLIFVYRNLILLFGSRGSPLTPPGSTDLRPNEPLSCYFHVLLIVFVSKFL